MGRPPLEQYKFDVKISAGLKETGVKKELISCLDRLELEFGREHVRTLLRQLSVNAIMSSYIANPDEFGKPIANQVQAAFVRTETRIVPEPAVKEETHELDASQLDIGSLGDMFPT